MLGGLRHFIWDTGKGFEVKTVDQLAAITLLGGVFLTLIFWLVFFII
jgi:succinate dehydrogenase / fumarate reductase cytochrome b subunit